MIDERMGARLEAAIELVPAGGGVVLRHHRSDVVLGERVSALCKRRTLVLAVAGDVALARRLGAAMVHNPQGEAQGLLVSRSVHSIDEAQAASDADLVFVSPVYASPSHPGNAGLGLAAALALARAAGVAAVALGGMDAERGVEAIAAGFHGWAGIDAFLRS